MLPYLIAVAAIFGGMMAGYRVGRSQTRIELTRLQADYADRAAKLEADAIRLATATPASLTSFAADTFPRDLMTSIAERLGEGVPAARLEAAIQSVPDEPTCDAGIETAQLVVHVAGGADALASAAFFGNQVMVTAAGRPGLDPAQPVDLRFLLPGGENSMASGPLPLTKSLSFAGEELRFAARASTAARQEVEITLQRCRWQ